MMDEKDKIFDEAEEIIKAIESSKLEYLKIIDSHEEREKSILLIEKQVNKLQADNEKEEAKFSLAK